MQETTKKINITLNGASMSVDAGLTLGELIDRRGLERRMIAVEYNGEIIPRLDYDATTIQEGDTLEVVHMVGGG